MRNTAKKATVRLSDIAKETGYSLSTVSKALNGRADVSEETRQTINAVLKRYGYSRKATGAKSQRIIEIVFQDFDNVWALEVLPSSCSIHSVIQIQTRCRCKRTTGPEA